MGCGGSTETKPQDPASSSPDKTQHVNAVQTIHLDIHTCEHTDTSRPVTPRPVTPEKPPRPVTPEKPPRPITPEKPPRPVTPEKPPRPITPEKPPRPITPEKPPRPITPEKPPRPITPEKPPRPITPEKPPRPITPEKPPRPETPEKPIRPETPEQPTKPTKPGNPSKPWKPSKPTKPIKEPETSIDGMRNQLRDHRVELEETRRELVAKIKISSAEGRDEVTNNYLSRILAVDKQLDNNHKFEAMLDEAEVDELLAQGVHIEIATMTTAAEHEDAANLVWTVEEMQIAKRNIIEAHNKRDIKDRQADVIREEVFADHEYRTPEEAAALHDIVGR